MKEAPKDLQHIDYEDICTSMVHHLVEEGLFTTPKDEVICLSKMSFNYIGNLILRDMHINVLFFTIHTIIEKIK